MKKVFLFLFLLIFVIKSYSQSYFEEIIDFQLEMSKEFADSTKSPLTTSDRLIFSSLNFFPIDSSFRILARFIKTPYELPFAMKTTTTRAPMYRKYAEAYFLLNGIDCKLNIYQNIDLTKKPNYEDYLFLPFTDLTNGDESYGGGRYIDLKVSDSDTIIIDFNKAYNPYCAYNHKYSCPIPPAENALSIEIKAGVKKYH
jgi:uncharacterized protein (DUF1684 family)